MSFRKLTVLFSTVLGLLAAVPAFAQTWGGAGSAIDLTSLSLRRQVNKTCVQLLEQFPVENTAPECSALHDVCRDSLLDQVKTAENEALQECLDANPAPVDQIACKQQIGFRDIVEEEKAKIAGNLQAACQPLPPPPAANPGNAQDSDGQIVAAAEGQGGCTMTGMGGASGNLLWMALGLVPLVGLRRKD